MSKSKTKFVASGVLEQDTFSTSIHGVTGQQVAEGQVPAGTVIYNLREDRETMFDGITIYRFEIKQGKSYYTEETYGRPVLSYN